MNQSNNQNEKLTIQIDKNTHEIIINDPSGMLIRVIEFGRALNVLARFVIQTAKNAVPVIVGGIIEGSGLIIEQIIISTHRVLDHIEEAKLRRVSEAFIRRMAQAAKYPDYVCKPNKIAVARMFCQDMAKFGVHLDIDDLLKSL